MVTLQLNFIGKVKIQGSQLVSGPEYLSPTINILTQKYGSHQGDETDYRLAKNLVDMMGGEILDHVPS